MSDSSKTIDDLRERLFATLDDLRSKDNPMPVERAQAICQVAQTIVNTAKVEVDFMRASGASESKFIGEPKKLPNGINGVTRHRLT